MVYFKYPKSSLFLWYFRKASHLHSLINFALLISNLRSSEESSIESIGDRQVVLLIQINLLFNFSVNKTSAFLLPSSQAVG